eukprot:TRINITY_DN3383_c0_g1_i1.p1 TRINITY_DN3383_c0_g1~~TRINITY_DN3383_c0_g1_i1.p1  ORF type:complete len:337 (+),score=73.06 TRINITY_DN3383_c0_g1_i1:145-1011(+)
MTEDGPIAISQGHHPILEKISSNPFIPNNAYISPTTNFHIITGPNMSGKSTFITQLCLIIIMAHMGCYVPASFASIRIMDQIFTRIGTADSIEANASSFMQEMRDIAYIIKSATKRSFIAIDELGRSTSNVAAIPICYSIGEYLMNLGAYTVFATHYTDLAQDLSEMYASVRTHRFLVEKNESAELGKGPLRFLYQLEDGFESTVPNYGIEMAMMVNLPPSLITLARELKDKIVKEEEKRKQRRQSKLRNSYYLCERLIMLKNSTLSEESLRHYIKDLQEKYLTDNEE